MKHLCTTVIITPSYAQSISYREKDPVVNISGLDYSANLGICGNFTYTLTNQDVSAFDTTIFTFDD